MIAGGDAQVRDILERFGKRQPVVQRNQSRDAPRYDAANDRYQYNWKTTKTMAGKCYQLQLGLADGNTVPVGNFRFN